MPNPKRLSLSLSLDATETTNAKLATVSSASEKVAVLPNGDCLIDVDPGDVVKFELTGNPDRITVMTSDGTNKECWKFDGKLHHSPELQIDENIKYTLLAEFSGTQYKGGTIKHWPK